jgi:transposase InsO family protein
MKPAGINQLYQAAFTKLPIANRRPHVAMAVLDCFSRYLLVLRVAVAPTIADLMKGLDEALAEARRVSEIPAGQAIALLTDRDPQVLTRLSAYLAELPLRCLFSQDRTFRSLGMVRSFMRALKDEEVSLHIYRSASEAQRSLELFRHSYNFERPHQALAYKCPAELFCKKVK